MNKKELLEEMESVSIQMDQLATAMLCHTKGMKDNLKASVRYHASELQGAAQMLEDWIEDMP